MPRALAVATLRKPLPEERLLEGGAGHRQVGTLVVTGLERLLSLAACLLGLLEIDLGGHVRRLGEDDHLRRQDLEEAADDRERLLGAALADPQLANTERRDERGVVRQDAELALDPRQLHGVDLVRVGEALRRHDLQLEWHEISPPTSRR